jgi:nucleotide-binding universal stress UspA family protein
MAPALGRRDRHVLCPVDFSDASRRALRYALAFAARTRAAVTVLYVNDPLLSSAAAAAGYDERRLNEQTMRELRRFAASAVGKGALARLHFVLASGNPAREIARHARTLGATLIAMGTHGLRGPGKFLLGSTTERTLRNAAIPVLAMPHAVPRKPSRGWPTGPVVAGLDLGPQSRADVRIAATIAKLLEADLLLVHVLPILRAPRWLRLARGGEDEAAQLTRARSRLAQLAATVDDDVTVSFRVVRGDPAPSLARLARRVKAGTLMLVLRPSAGLFGMPRGAVTYQVLTSAATPVLAVPASTSSDRLLRDSG